MDLEKDIFELDISALVRDSIEEALEYEESNNIGENSNHCDEKTKKYYLGLANNDKEALLKKKSLIDKFIKDNAFE
ncbi:hypothetical protein [Campylobacter molothri]|uniref:hypothetical protein n=1 Tax=Campylobacter molothri TaxID=1032242 RepID=UPI00301BCA7C|nr:hypothetical protein [Campylobacter sp. RM10534]